MWLLFVWTLVGLGAALGMARSWFVPAGGGGAVLLLILFFIAIKGTPLTEMVAMIAMAAGCLGGTVAAFASAWRRKLVSIRTVLGHWRYTFSSWRSASSLGVSESICWAFS